MEIYLFNKNKNNICYCYTEDEIELEDDLSNLTSYELEYIKSIIDRVIKKKELMNE